MVTLKNQSIPIFAKLKILFSSLIALYSINFYLFWDKNFYLLFFCLCLTLIFCIEQFLYKFRKSLAKKNLIIICAWIVLYTYVYVINTSGFLSLFFDFISKLFPVLILIISTDDEKKEFLNFFTTLISILLLISLVFYFIYLLGIDLPHEKITMPNQDFYDYFENYYFFITCNDSRTILFARFQGMFTEPGQIGMIIALLLYGNQYKLKNFRNIILLVSCLLTLSLASYILLIIGLILFHYLQSNHKIKDFIKVLFLCILSITIVTIYYNKHPDTIISKWIISRVIPDGKRGISGNNRNTSEFIQKYDENKSSINTFYFGTGVKSMEKYNAGNSSYRNYIFMYGLFGVIVLLLFYIVITLKNYSITLLGLLLLYFFSFLQRPYALWSAEIFIFISSATTFFLKNKD